MRATEEPFSNPYTPNIPNIPNIERMPSLSGLAPWEGLSRSEGGEGVVPLQESSFESVEACFTATKAKTETAMEDNSPEVASSASYRTRMHEDPDVGILAAPCKCSTLVLR